MLIKTCPKCNNNHSKSGLYCSRSCANSRTFSEESNKKRSISNKISGEKFWNSNPKANEIRNRRRKTYYCKQCHTNIVPKKEKICLECKSLKLPTQKKSLKQKQILSFTDTLPTISDKKLLSYGVKGKGATLERELERRKKISEKAKIKNGGYRKGSGRGKKGWYKGIFCDSSWELAYVLWCELNSIRLERNSIKFDYIFEDKKYKYLPDFIIDNSFIEIKGYLSNKNLEKIKQFPHDKYKLILLTEKEMKPILSTIINLYGKDYIKLYEN